MSDLGICKDCWNDGCREDEELRKSKIEVCQHMHDYPEEWKDV